MRSAILSCVFLGIAIAAVAQGPPIPGIEYVEIDPGSPFVHASSEIILPPNVGEYTRGFVEELSQPARIFALYKHSGDPRTSVGIYLYDARVPEGAADDALDDAERDVKRELRTSGDPHRRSHVRRAGSNVEMDPRISGLPGRRVLFDVRDSRKRGYVYEYLLFHHRETIVRAAIYRPESSPELLDEFIASLPWHSAN